MLGRGSAAVTTGGHTVLVEDVEAALAGLPGVLDVAVIGQPHPRFGSRSSRPCWSSRTACDGAT